MVSLTQWFIPRESQKRVFNPASLAPNATLITTTFCHLLSDTFHFSKFIGLIYNYFCNCFEHSHWRKFLALFFLLLVKYCHKGIATFCYHSELCSGDTASRTLKFRKLDIQEGRLVQDLLIFICVCVTKRNSEKMQWSISPGLCWRPHKLREPVFEIKCVLW